MLAPSLPNSFHFQRTFLRRLGKKKLSRQKTQPQRNNNNKNFFSLFLSLSLSDTMPRPSSLLAAAAALLCLSSGALAQPLTLGSDFLITIDKPLLEPWQNGASATSGNSAAIGVTASRFTLGPCVYRTAHWHASAWEVQTPVTPGVRRDFFYFVARGRAKP